MRFSTFYEIWELMTEEKTRIRKVIEGGLIRYTRVKVTDADIIVEKNEEIAKLKSLIDQLRNKIEILEAEQQRKALRDAPVDSAESYNIYF